MAKILLTIIILLTLAFIVIAIYCSLVIAGRSDDSKGNNSGGNNGEMFCEKQICPRCKTGKYTYDLDPKSEACPYIGCWRRNKCHFYKPLERKFKKDFFSKHNKDYQS